MKNASVIIILITVLISCNSKKEGVSEQAEVVTKTVQTEESTSIEGESIIEEERQISENVEAVENETEEVVEEKEPVEAVSESEEPSEVSNEEKTRKVTVEEKARSIEEKTEEVEEEKQISVTRPDHGAWDQLTKKYVSSSGKVNYEGFKSERGKIAAYVENLKNLPPKAEWKRNEKLAYWINLYNALTVDLILENYPLKSIMEINGGKAWDLKVITISGKEYSLNDIEHGTIRKQFNEPRIHFAVNCAAKSCPKLLDGAFLPDQLNEQLEKQAKYFINNESKNQLSSDATKLSRIFDWYGSDFGDLKTYLAKYSTSYNPEAPAEFLEYEWTLNN